MLFQIAFKEAGMGFLLHADKQSTHTVTNMRMQKTLQWCYLVRSHSMLMPNGKTLPN